MTLFSSVVLVDRRGWLLLQERDEHPAIDPERWGFCGGHVEPGEDHETAAYRELAEETGLHLEGLQLVGEYAVFHPHTATDDTFRLYAARCDLTDDDIDCREGRRIVFVDPAQVPDLDLTRATEIALPDFLGSDLYAGWRP